MKTKEDVIKEIEETKEKIRKHNRINKISKDEVVNIVLKILEWENLETQYIINRYYMDWKSYEEISKELDYEEYEILAFFQFIVFKIKYILNIEEKKQNENWTNSNPYAASNFKWQRNKNKGFEKKWGLLDKKT